jgi:hypothetical protein
MDFKDLLQKHDLDLSRVMMMRHRPDAPSVRRILPWLAAERPEVYNAYQQIQGPRAEKALARAAYAVSFIAQGSDKALFVGMYRQLGSRLISERNLLAIPAMAELQRLGDPVDGRAPCLLFDLALMEHCSEYKGRLVITWPPGRLWWRWANTKGAFPIHAIHEESFLESEMPDWDELSLTWKDLSVLPTKWKIVLSQWRGVYYIFDTRAKAGYVGSAYGKDNILGRWLDYAATGHGGNKKLRLRNPDDFVFTILQRASPDLGPEEVIRLEESWKNRLHTRDCGLNDN